jgi:hypothetical protein
MKGVRKEVVYVVYVLLLVHTPLRQNSRVFQGRSYLCV